MASAGEGRGRPVVARIGKAHGLRGEVTVATHTDNPRQRYVSGARFDLDPGLVGGLDALTLATARLHSGTWLLGFEQVPDRSTAESLRGQRLLLPAPVDGEPANNPDVENVQNPESTENSENTDSWYPEELVGLRVEDPTGSELGTVAALRIRPAQDLLEIRLVDGRIVPLPFVTALVPTVDVPGGRVVVVPPCGLFDLAE